jgi:hypothetical protein
MTLMDRTAVAQAWPKNLRIQQARQSTVAEAAWTRLIQSLMTAN